VRAYLPHISYFLTGNTAQGHMSLVQQSLKRSTYLCVIDGPYLSDNCRVMQRLYEALREHTSQLELVHHPSAPNDLQGIIIPQIKLAILSSTPENVIPYEHHIGSVTILNVYDYYNTDAIALNQAHIDELTTAIIEKHQQAYRGYAQALAIHDDWEKIYIEQSNFRSANAYTDQLTHKLLPDRELCEKRVDPLYRFLGAATPQGAVDFVPELTAGLKRYLIKGRPGSGKSTLLRKLLARGSELGYELEVYQCGLDPNSLDMIICRQLGFAIFDSTAPHEYDPTEANDEVIDMYEISIAPDTDERFKTELQEIAAAYRAQMKISNEALAKASALEALRAPLVQAALNETSLLQSEQLLINSIIQLFQRHNNN
jgi:hypothetical protein